MEKPKEVAAISSRPYSLFVAVYPATNSTPKPFTTDCTAMPPTAMMVF